MQQSMTSLSTWIVVALSEKGVCLDGMLQPRVAAHLCTALLGVPEDRCTVETVVPDDVHLLSLHRTVKRILIAVKRTEASAAAAGAQAACLVLVLLPSLSTAATRRCVLSSLSFQRSALKTAWILTEVLYFADRGCAPHQKLAALQADELAFRLVSSRAPPGDAPQHWTLNTAALLKLGTHECGSHSPDGPMSVDDGADVALTWSLWRELCPATSLVRPPAPSSAPWGSQAWECLFLGISESVDFCSSAEAMPSASDVELRSVVHRAAVRWCCSGERRVICFVQGAVHASGVRFTRIQLEKHFDKLASRVKTLPVLSWFSFLGSSIAAGGSGDSGAADAEESSALPLPFHLTDAAILSRLCGIDLERSLLLVDPGACPWAEAVHRDEQGIPQQQQFTVGVTLANIRDECAVDRALERFCNSVPCSDGRVEAALRGVDDDRLPASLCSSPLRSCVVATGSRVRATLRWAVPAEEIVSATVLTLPAIEAVCDVATLRLGRQYRQSKLLDGASVTVACLSRRAVAASAICWSSNRAKQYLVGVVCIKGHVELSRCPCGSSELQVQRESICRHTAALCVTLLAVEVASLPFDSNAAAALFRGAGSNCGQPCLAATSMNSDHSQPHGINTPTAGTLRANDAVKATIRACRYVPVAPAVTEQGLPLHMLLSSSKQPRRNGAVEVDGAGERKRRRAHDDSEPPSVKRKGAGVLSGPSAPAIRRLTPFFFFMTTQRGVLRQQPDAPQKPSEVARKLAEMWKALSPEEKEAVAADCRAHNEEADRQWAAYRDTPEYLNLLALAERAKAERQRNPSPQGAANRRNGNGATEVAGEDAPVDDDEGPESFGHRNPEWRRNDKGEWVCDWDSADDDDDDGGADTRQHVPQCPARLGSLVLQRHPSAAARGVADPSEMPHERRSTLAVRRGHSGVETQATLGRSANTHRDEESSDDDNSLP